MRLNGEGRPDQSPLIVEDPAALVGQYIRHRDSLQIFKIAEVGRDGVTVYQAEGFGGPTGGTEILVTWNSLKYKHMIMVHVADVHIKPGENQ